ncbi:MAG: pyridoxamine 5'-phosphate oxidase family protein [Pseudomonadota bacterium]
MSLPTQIDEIPTWTVAQLVRGTVDRRSAFKWPVLVTGSEISGPSGRVVVLRRFNAEMHQAVIYTDRRSKKVRHLADKPHAELVFFDPKNLLQIRLRGTAQVHANGTEKDSAFDQLPARSRSDYSTVTEPGGRLVSTKPERDLKLSRDHFALIEIVAQEYDILSLEREGHRRAKVSVAGHTCQASWVTP